MIVDGFDVRSQIEETPYASDDGRERPDVREANLHSETLTIMKMGYLAAAQCSVDFNRAQITRLVDDFDAGNRARTQECEDVFPVIGRAITKSEHDVVL